MHTITNIALTKQGHTVTGTSGYRGYRGQPTPANNRRPVAAEKREAPKRSPPGGYLVSGTTRTVVSCKVDSVPSARVSVVL